MNNYLSNLLPHLIDGIDRRAKRHKYADDPVAWAREYLGVQVWSKQREILYSIRDNRNTAVAAGHGVGKTWIAAIAVGWWVDTHPVEETFVASTAPTMDQVALLWDNVRRVHSLAQTRHEEYLRRLEKGLPLGEYEAADHALPGHITGDHKWKLKDGTLIGQGRKPPDNKGDVAFQGRHATYLLAIGDEAVGISEAFLDALGNIATGDFNRRLLIANPTDPSSAMAKIWRNNLDAWTRMHISVLESPKITNEPDFDIALAPAISGMEYVDQARDEWGEDDPRYISRVTGQWAFDAGNTVFTEFDLVQAANTTVLPDPEGRIVQGWDIARMGQDATIGYQTLEGEVWETDPETGKPTIPTGRRGLHIRRVDRWTKAPLVGTDPANLGSAQRIHAHAIGDGAAVLNIDASGLGSGVIDGLVDLNKGQYRVVEVFGGAPPTDRRSYINTRAEQYFELKRKMFAGEIDLDPADTDLFEELRGVVYEYTDTGAIKIESKDSIKRRGAKSPDHADALWYAAFDVWPLIDHPLGHLERGDQVSLDPWELLALSRDPSQGYPI